MTSSHTESASRMNVGYQMAYARWAIFFYGEPSFTHFGHWAEMQGQLDNPRPYLLTDEEQSRG